MSAREDAVHRAAHWLCGSALPLWAGVGFHSGRQAFEERLDFDGRPIADAPQRIMVQARQIATFASAAAAGLFPAGRGLAEAAAASAMARYHRVDGQPGWVFSIDAAGRVIDARRDLYAHAFLLFAFSWLLRATGQASYAEAAFALVEDIDRLFRAPAHGGYIDARPRADMLRRQNPHMHLFEALLALHDATGDGGVLRRCAELRRLAVERLMDPVTGALREYFADDWAVHPAPGEGSVEPGHLFEWAWLLRWYERASGEDQSPVVAPMLTLALSAGLDHASGRIIDEIGEDGRPRQASSRAWPHAEAIKALTVETLAGRGDHAGLVARLLDRLLDAHCPPRLAGGWIDHLDAHDRPRSAMMPASTLYHVHFGILEAMRLREGAPVLQGAEGPASSAF